MTYASRLLTVSAAHFQSIKFTRETKRRLRSHMQIRIAGTHNGNQEQSTDLQHDAALADLDIAHAQGAGVMTTCTNPNSFAADRDAAGTREKNSCFLILIQLQVSLA